MQHPVDAAVRHPRCLERLALDPAVALGLAGEEGELVGVEELPVAGGEPQPGISAAVEDELEEGEQPGIGAVPLVHRVGVAAGI